MVQLIFFAKINFKVPGPPKLLIWDINANCTLREFIFPPNVLSWNGSFANDIVVDETRGFAYISNTVYVIFIFEGLKWARGFFFLGLNWTWVFSEGLIYARVFFFEVGDGFCGCRSENFVYAWVFSSSFSK
jgi:hypothetical protein